MLSVFSLYQSIYTRKKGPSSVDNSCVQPAMMIHLSGRSASSSQNNAISIKSFNHYLARVIEDSIQLGITTGKSSLTFQFIAVTIYVNCIDIVQKNVYDQ